MRGGEELGFRPPAKTPKTADLPNALRVRLATAVISTLRPLTSSAGSLSRQERRKAATAAAILDAAEVLIRERGFQAATIDEMTSTNIGRKISATESSRSSTSVTRRC
jgi:hypothetical protein